GAADIYSLGCVVFECVNGRPPFADREGMRVLWAHLQDEPPDPAADRTDISSEFARALKSALRKEPAERPRSSIEYARSLSRAAGRVDERRLFTTQRDVCERSQIQVLAPRAQPRRGVLDQAHRARDNSLLLLAAPVDEGDDRRLPVIRWRCWVRFCGR